MQRSCILVVALLLCGRVEAQRVELGTYVMSQGAAEVSRERYRFDGTTLADTVEFPSRGVRMESIASYDRTYTPVSYALDLFRGAGHEPVQRVNVAFDNTAAVWSTQTELGDDSGVTQLDGPYAFMQNLVFAHLAVVLLKYDHERAGEQRLNVWMPEQAAALTMEIEFASSTEGTVEIAGTVMNVVVDESGWLRRASVAAQNVTVESINEASPG
jgi:hypothetical protein